MENQAPYMYQPTTNEMPFYKSPYFMSGVALAALAVFGVDINDNVRDSLFQSIPGIVTGVSGLFGIIYGSKRNTLTSPPWMPGPNTDNNIGNIYPYTPPQAPIGNPYAPNMPPQGPYAAPYGYPPQNPAGVPGNMYQSPFNVPQG